MSCLPPGDLRGPGGREQERAAAEHGPAHHRAGLSLLRAGGHRGRRQAGGRQGRARLSPVDAPLISYMMLNVEYHDLLIFYLVLCNWIESGVVCSRVQIF